MGLQKNGVCLLAASGRSLRIELIDHGKISLVCYVSLKDLEAVLHKRKKTATIIKPVGKINRI